MQNISFDKGSYREYALNDEGVIRIDTEDFGIIERFKTAQKEIGEYGEYLETLKNPDESILTEMDSKAREIINRAFNSDVCTVAFGAKNCFSIAGNGKPILINFLEALTPVLNRDFGESMKKQKAAYESKIAKYIPPTAPVIPTAPPVAGLANPYGTALPDVSTLSPEQKRALIAQLIC